MFDALVPTLKVPVAAEPPLGAWPSAERPRERLIAKGARELGDAELLALLLRSGTQGGSALTLARRLQVMASARGGWAQLQLADLMSLKGMGLAKSAGLLAALEWGRREAVLLEKAAPLASSSAAAAELRQLLQGRRQEHFGVLALDARRRVLAVELISQGSLTQSLAHPREIFRTAIKLGAAGIIVGHNHPSGDPLPSPEDHAVTLRLREAAELLAVPLLDHVIVGDSVCFSYADSGWPRS